MYIYIYNYAISDIVQYSSANIKTPRVIGIRPARNIAKVFTSVDMATTSNAAERLGLVGGCGGEMATGWIPEDSVLSCLVCD